MSFYVYQYACVMPLVRQAPERPQTCASDRRATEIGYSCYQCR